ncbi:hypothetical protein, partial [Streptomyces sp. SID5789]|uniref:hypothetical protein n=1 Tax=Streptomyces sp. SID5789 TaxID=2690310 RepID=UPI00137C62B9
MTARPADEARRALREARLRGETTPDTRTDTPTDTASETGAHPEPGTSSREPARRPDGDHARDPDGDRPRRPG